MYCYYYKYDFSPASLASLFFEAAYDKYRL